MSLKNNINQYPTTELAPIICEFLNQGKNVVLTARGNSMRPMLRNLKDNLTISPCNPSELLVGDVVFYKRKSGIFVVHRIIGCLPSGEYLLMGDFQLRVEKVNTSQILGKVTSFTRGKKVYSVEDKKYLKYVKFWVKTRFWRRAYMSFSYRSGQIKK